MLQKIPLDQGWQFKQSSTSTKIENGIATSYLPVSQFPTVSHIDLLHHNLIPDPYIDSNELACLWVNDANWEYKTTFTPPKIAAGEKAVLVFEGLDTIVDVFLNGKLVLEGRNMHREYRVDVTGRLGEGEGKEVELVLKFRNAPEWGRKELKRIGYKGNGTDVHFGGPERLFVRKAQYHWGWDWGPAICTSGPWKPIYLEKFTGKIGEMIVRQVMDADLKCSTIEVKGFVDSPASGDEIIVEIIDPDGQVLLVEKPNIVGYGSYGAKLQVKNPKLWNIFLFSEHKEQPLYTVKVTLSGKDVKTQKIGLRRLRLLQHPLKKAEGTSFIFELNNIRLFCGGSCWIPGDNMLPRMTPNRYEDWLLLAKSGNQTMIRVWGGGIIEDDAFYDICDREGILVWQDFLFACGDYPASDDFIELIKPEFEHQMKRVGHHPSLAIWAGNNEDYMLADRWGWDLDYSDEKGPWDQTNFPARKIYERVLPDIHAALGGDVPYIRSSPYGGKFANDPTAGDTHIWNVWHGEMSPYQDYQKYTSRFVSEFGFESAPDLRTLHKAITNPKERHSQSRTFDVHDKGPGHQRRYPMYFGENFRFRMNPLKDFVYCTQFLQAEAMKYAYNCWRREFRGPGEENCSGVLVWQLNDIWPATSWALVDVNLHRKPAFYITKRALAPVVIGMERVITQNPPYIVTSHQPKKAALEVWAVNGYLEELEAILKFDAFDIETGSRVVLAEKEMKLKLKPNQTTELCKLKIPQCETTVVVAYLDDAETGKRLARWVSWPEPLKFVQFAPDLRVEVKTTDDEVVLATNAPVKGVVVSVSIEDGDDAVFDDNFIDLVPEEEIRIGAKGLNGRKVQAKWLCDWENEKGFVL